MNLIKRTGFAVCAALTLTAGSALANGPAHRWTFDEAAGAVAYDKGFGTRADGTLGAGAARTPGTVGSGAVSFQPFDLEGYVAMPGSVAALGTGDFTVSFWMKKTPSSRFGEIVGNRGAQSSAGNFFDFRASDTGVSLEVSEDGNGRGYIPVGTDFPMADGAWHKVTGVRSGANTWLYLDGVLRATGSASDGVIANLVEGAAFTVGVNDVEREFRDLNCGCSFDDVRIYERALDAFEIAFPADQIGLIIAAIDAMGLDHGITNALEAKLNAAQQSLASGNTRAALGELGAFMLQLAAQAGKKKVTVSQALQLGTMAVIVVGELVER